jgi:putative transposase
MGNKYAITDKEAMYFISFATVGWIDVFSRKEYRDILIHNLKYCQEKKGLTIYSWCIMSNHLHLVVQAKGHNLSDILRDFKSYTAKVLLNAIQELPESRREWMLKLFKEEGEKNSNNTSYQFWRQDNQFKEVHSKDFAFQKSVPCHVCPLSVNL